LLAGINFLRNQIAPAEDTNLIWNNDSATKKKMSYFEFIKLAKIAKIFFLLDFQLITPESRDIFIPLVEVKTKIDDYIKILNKPILQRTKNELALQSEVEAKLNKSYKKYLTLNTSLSKRFYLDLIYASVKALKLHSDSYISKTSNAFIDKLMHDNSLSIYEEALNLIEDLKSHLFATKIIDQICADTNNNEDVQFSVYTSKAMASKTIQLLKERIPIEFFDTLIQFRRITINSN
jgi:hypothetical protein